MSRRLEVAPYDPRWPAAFERLRRDIERNLAGFDVEFHHIGSTSVPGLAAKPKIDIDAVILDRASLSSAVDRMRRVAGYEFHGEPFGDGRWTFTRPHEGFGERLYLCGPENPAHVERIAFRDYLRSHPDAAVAYAALKHRLVGTVNGDVDAYTRGKSGFVADILRLAAAG